VIESIPTMPEGTFGFRVRGDITRADYTDVMLPPLRQAVADGERLRVLVAVGPEYHEEAGAIWAGFKADIELGVHHRSAWERVAVVSDIGWVLQATKLFTWMMPGEVRTFAEKQLREAMDWVAG
jgi:hypothetical protein